MQELGFDVIEVTHPADALHLIEQCQDLQLVVTDLVLPGGLTGDNIAQGVQALVPAVRVLFISGLIEAPASLAEQQPHTRLLPKPFTLEQLGRGRIERSQDSAGAITLTPGNYQREVLYRYALGGSPSEHPYAAAVFSLEQPLENYAGVSFVARAERPLRMSVQLRQPGSGGGVRWKTSVYLDATPRPVVMRFEQFAPVERSAGPVRVGQLDSLLLVVDDVNTPLGNGGRVWVRDLDFFR